MTDSDITFEQVRTWQQIPGYSRYRASRFPESQTMPDGSTRSGQIRNVATGDIMKRRLNSSGYWQLNVINDAGETKTVTEHSLVLRTFEGEPEGREACHAPGQKPDNSCPPLRWDFRDANEAERIAAMPPKARKPVYDCIRCGAAKVGSPRRRCHECVVEVGQLAAALLRKGKRLDEASDDLDYGNPAYLHVLAVKYGGWGHCPACSCSPTVKLTLRERLRRGLGRSGGDTQ